MPDFKPDTGITASLKGVQSQISSLEGSLERLGKAFLPEQALSFSDALRDVQLQTGMTYEQTVKYKDSLIELSKATNTYRVGSLLRITAELKNSTTMMAALRGESDRYIKLLTTAFPRGADQANRALMNLNASIPKLFDNMRSGKAEISDFFEILQRGGVEAAANYKSMVEQYRSNVPVKAVNELSETWAKAGKSADTTFLSMSQHMEKLANYAGKILPDSFKAGFSSATRGAGEVINVLGTILGLVSSIGLAKIAFPNLKIPGLGGGKGTGGGSGGGMGDLAKGMAGGTIARSVVQDQIVMRQVVMQSVARSGGFGGGPGGGRIGGGGGGGGMPPSLPGGGGPGAAGGVGGWFRGVGGGSLGMGIAGAGAAAGAGLIGGELVSKIIQGIVNSNRKEEDKVTYGLGEALKIITGGGITIGEKARRGREEGLGETEKSLGTRIKSGVDTQTKMTANIEMLRAKAEKQYGAEKLATLNQIEKIEKNRLNVNLEIAKDLSFQSKIIDQNAENNQLLSDAEDARAEIMFKTTMNSKAALEFNIKSLARDKEILKSREAQLKAMTKNGTVNKSNTVVIALQKQIELDRLNILNKEISAVEKFAERQRLLLDMSKQRRDVELEIIKMMSGESVAATAKEIENSIKDLNDEINQAQKSIEELRGAKGFGAKGEKESETRQEKIAGLKYSLAGQSTEDLEKRADELRRKRSEGRARVEKLEPYEQEMKRWKTGMGGWQPVSPFPETTSEKEKAAVKESQAELDSINKLLVAKEKLNILNEEEEKYKKGLADYKPELAEIKELEKIRNAMAKQDQIAATENAVMAKSKAEEAKVDLSYAMQEAEYAEKTFKSVDEVAAAKEKVAAAAIKVRVETEKARKEAEASKNTHEKELALLEQKAKAFPAGTKERAEAEAELEKKRKLAGEAAIKEPDITRGYKAPEKEAATKELEAAKAVITGPAGLKSEMIAAREAIVDSTISAAEAQKRPLMEIASHVKDQIAIAKEAKTNQENLLDDMRKNGKFSAQELLDKAKEIAGIDAKIASLTDKYRRTFEEKFTALTMSLTKGSYIYKTEVSKLGQLGPAFQPFSGDLLTKKGELRGKGTRSAIMAAAGYGEPETSEAQREIQKLMGRSNSTLDKIEENTRREADNTKDLKDEAKNKNKKPEPVEPKVVEPRAETARAKANREAYEAKRAEKIKAEREKRETEKAKAEGEKRETGKVSGLKPGQWRAEFGGERYGVGAEEEEEERKFEKERDREYERYVEDYYNTGISEGRGFFPHYSPASVIDKINRKREDPRVTEFIDERGWGAEEEEIKTNRKMDRIEFMKNMGWKESEKIDPEDSDYEQNIQKASEERGDKIMMDSIRGIIERERGKDMARGMIERGEMQSGREYSAEIMRGIEERYQQKDMINAMARLTFVLEGVKENTLGLRGENLVTLGK